VIWRSSCEARAEARAAERASGIVARGLPWFDGEAEAEVVVATMLAEVGCGELMVVVAVLGSTSMASSFLISEAAFSLPLLASAAVGAFSSFSSSVRRSSSTLLPAAAAVTLGSARVARKPMTLMTGLSACAKGTRPLLR